MKTSLKLLIFVLLFLPFSLSAQCLDHARKGITTTLAGYVHNGAFNTTELKANESVELIEMFPAGKSYRVSVVSPQNLQNIRLEIFDMQRNSIQVVENSTSLIYDFTPATSQMLIIKVLVKSEAGAQTHCVAVLIGEK